MYMKITKFVASLRNSGLKATTRKVLLYFGLLNVVRFREPRLKLACDIEYSQLPSSTNIPHPVGIAIASCAEIGHNVTILQNVTIGMKDGGCPTICDGAEIHAGAVVIGDVRVGTDAVVGANAVVVDDVPDGATVAGVPARELKKSATVVE